jgi:hypothetical protein
MKEIEEIQSLVNLIRSVGDIDKEDFDRIINATKSIESKIKQLELDNESLKCCGNCKYYKQDRGIDCLRPTINMCSHWYPSEPDAINYWQPKENS